MEQLQTQEINSEKPVKEKNDAFKKVIRYTKRYHIFIFISMIFAIGAVVIQLIAPNVVSNMTDYILLGMGNIFNPEVGYYNTHSDVVRTGVTLIILYSIMFVIFYIQQITMARVSVKVSLSLRKDMGKKINRLPLSFLDSTQVGENLSRITNDVDALTRSLNWSVSAIITATVMIIGSLIAMFYNQWIMAFTALGSTILGFFLMAVIMGKAQKYFLAQQTELGEINAHTEEYFTGHTVLKTNNARGRVSKIFDTKNHKLYTSSWKAQFYGGVMIPLMFFLGNLAFVTVSIVGGVLAFNGTITFGVIIAFMLYVDLFTRPLGDIAQAMMELQTMNAAA